MLLSFPIYCGCLAIEGRAPPGGITPSTALTALKSPNSSCTVSPKLQHSLSWRREGAQQVHGIRSLGLEADSAGTLGFWNPRSQTFFPTIIQVRIFWYSSLSHLPGPQPKVKCQSWLFNFGFSFRLMCWESQWMQAQVLEYLPPTWEAQAEF